MADLNGIPLGQHSEYPAQYDRSVLFPIERSIGRAAIGVVDRPLPFVGVDIWNAYELSWLTSKGKPVVALMEMRVPAQSLNIVESKSLKLYLGSLNQTRFASWDDVKATLEKDISAVVGLPVDILLQTLDQGDHFDVQLLDGRCIDALDVECDKFTVDASYLGTTQNRVSETLYSHLLRSCCPVTNQPDWASVVVQYEGKQIIDAGLLRYLVSFRDNQEFHEQCVERIFMDLWQHCEPETLLVYARYTRRGGIDINPVRSSIPFDAVNVRLIRQ